MSVPPFQPISSKTKTKLNMPCSHAFSRVWRRLHIFASIPDWFIALFASVGLARVSKLGLGFTTLK